MPSFRGITDRWLLTSNGRFGGMEHQLGPLPDGPDEKPLRSVASVKRRHGARWRIHRAGTWAMLLENAQHGTSGAFGRQVTLNTNSAGDDQTQLVLNALESVAERGHCCGAKAHGQRSSHGRSI